MKKLLNDPRHVVDEVLDAMAMLDPDLARVAGEDVIVRSDIDPDPSRRPVALISGGGSGHEPAHAGYVGKGMLSAAVAGAVFTSPSVDAVMAAIHAVAGPAGALLIIKNYTGDRLNFGLAAEMARSEGIAVEIVVVADDVALAETVSPDRRRGIAGTVLVHKVAGAAAARGSDLATVATLARAAAADIVTAGVGLSSCTIPEAGKPGFELADDEMEYGLGIHGEKGVRRETIRSARAITGDLLTDLRKALGPRIDERIALFVNGLGATTPMELMIMAREALSVLNADGADARLAYVGNFMTALEMAGCSISVLPLDDTREELLQAEASPVAWPSRPFRPGGAKIVTVPDTDSGIPNAKPGAISSRLRRACENVAAALERAEPQLTDLDARAGDGDLGASMMRGANALRSLPDGAFNDVPTVLEAIASRLRRAIAGSSGPFYATGLLRAANAWRGEADEARRPERAFEAALSAIREIGGAQQGDRTMVDALQPAVYAWQKAQEDGSTVADALDAAATAALTGAETTANMYPKYGRAAYLGERAIGSPDGGAMAVAVWLKALAATARTER